MTLLKEYLKSQILKLEGTNVQEIQAKSNILVQNYFKISKADLEPVKKLSSKSCFDSKPLTFE